MLNNDKEITQLERIAEAMAGADGISWAALVRRADDTLEEVIRRRRPCFGEMRRYGPTSTRPDDPHPGDIPRTIPRGKREAFAASVPDLDSPDHNELLMWMLNPVESPWRRGLGRDVTIQRNSKGRINAFHFTDTEIDPTVLVNLLVTIRNLGSNMYTISMAESKAAGLTFSQRIVARVFAGKPVGYGNGVVNTDYYLSQNLSLKRFFSGDSLDLSNGRTWRDEEDYNRPELHLIFGGRSDLPDYSDKQVRSFLARGMRPDWSLDNVFEGVKQCAVLHGIGE